MKNTAVKNVKTRDNAKPSAELRFLALHILSVVCAFALAQCSPVKGYAPFGVAFASALPPSYLGTGALGAVLGYFVSGVDPVRYVCAIFIAAIIRYSLGSYRSLSERALFSPAAAMIAIASTGLASSISANAGAREIAYCISEALFAGAGAYFMDRVFKIKPKRTVGGLTSSELSCVVIIACLVISGLTKYEIYTVSPARALALFAVLFCAKIGREALGSAAGLLAGLAAVTGGSPALTAGAYAAGGLIAGVFAQFGKIGTAAAFAVSSSVALVSLSQNGIPYGYIAEIFIASLAFALLPRSLSDRLESLAHPVKDRLTYREESRTVSERLKKASAALCGSAEAAGELAAGITNAAPKSVDDIKERMFSECCKDCGLHNYCWEQNYVSSSEDLQKMCAAAERNDEFKYDDAPENFSERCIKSEEYVRLFAALFSDYRESGEAKERAKMIGERIRGEFALAAAILSDASEDYAEDCVTDEKYEPKIISVMNSFGIFPQKAVCKINRIGRMQIEVTTPAIGVKVDKFPLAATLSEACKRNFAPPKTKSGRNGTLLIFYERPTYTVRTGVCRLNGDKSAISGDACAVYDLNASKKVIMICDGMGSGGAAAVNSGMAVNLIKRLTSAGVGFERALDIANEALIGSGDSEALTTVDCAVIDTFSGGTEFIKAGAARSFARHNYRSVPIESVSLPIGILSEIRVARTRTELNGGDVAVIMSDGAAGGDSSWIMDELNDFEGDDANALAEKLANLASAKCGEKYRDDITVIAAIIEAAQPT